MDEKGKNIRVCLPSIVDFEPSNFTSLDPLFLPFEHIEVYFYSNSERNIRPEEATPIAKNSDVSDTPWYGKLQTKNIKVAGGGLSSRSTRVLEAAQDAESGQSSLPVKYHEIQEELQRLTITRRSLQKELRRYKTSTRHAADVDIQQ